MTRFSGEKHALSFESFLTSVLAQFIIFCTSGWCMNGPGNRISLLVRLA